jgi:hypothetical protein
MAELMGMFKKKKQVEKKKKEVRLVSRAERQAIIKKLMRECIGRGNAISHTKLFEAIYGPIENYSDLQMFFLWHRIRMDMNWIRKTTKCFIGVDVANGSWYYYVVKDMDDAKPYMHIMDTTVKKCLFMKERCKKAVEQEWYKDL